MEWFLQYCNWNYERNIVLLIFSNNFILEQKFCYVGCRALKDSKNKSSYYKAFIGIRHILKQSLLCFGCICIFTCFENLVFISVYFKSPINIVAVSPKFSPSFDTVKYAEE
jgi:hypothetical protein